jgi:hypothetical protein
MDYRKDLLGEKIMKRMMARRRKIFDVDNACVRNATLILVNMMHR